MYLIISVAAGVFLCLTLIIGRLIIQKRRTQKESNGNNPSNPNDGKYSGQSSTGETQIPVGFGADDISDIDGDIDLTTPLPLPSLSSRNEVIYLVSIF